MRAEVLGRAVFTVDGDAVAWGAVADVARASGEWPSPTAHPPGAGTVEERATAFRYERGLLSADETAAWFSRWGITVAAWLAHLGGTVDDPEEAAWIEAVTSGTLERTAWRLAQSLAAYRAMGGGPWHADHAGWPSQAQLDEAMQSFVAREASPERVAAAVAERAVAWTVFELDEVRPADEAMARRLGAAETGGSFAKAAAQAGLAVVQTRSAFEDLPNALQPRLLGAGPGDVVGPLLVNGGWDVVAVRSRTVPNGEDDWAVQRARARLVDDALGREMARRVRWLEPVVPPRPASDAPTPEQPESPSEGNAPDDFMGPSRRTRRFPTVWAVDEMDCGAACLAAVCRHFGRAVPLTYVRDVVGTGLDGTSLRGLAAGARRLGLATQTLKASLSRLESLPLPAICHWQGNHWVVLHDVGEQYVRVVDPVAGPRRLARREWLDGWSGYSCLVAPTPALQGAPEGRPPWRWLVPFARPHRRTFAAATVLALVAAGLQMLVPVGAGLIVDEAIAGGDRGLLHVLALGMVGVLLAAVGAGLVQRWLLARLAVRFDAATLDHVTDRLLGLPAAYFASRRTGDIERRLGGMRQVRLFLVQEGVMGITAATQVAVAIALMVSFSLRLSLVFLATVPLYALAMAYSRRHLRPLLSTLEEAFARYGSRQLDAIRGIETVKARGAEQSLRARLRAQFDAVAGRVYRSDVAFMRYDAAVELVRFLTLALVLWFGGLLVLDGALTLGELVAFNGLVVLANGPVGGLLRLWDELQYASVLLGRVDDVLSQEPEQGADRSRLRPVPHLDGRISIQGVTIRTAGMAGTAILEDVHLEIEPGQAVALVGFSGAGKSTLARCLLGLVRPASGRILFDGVDLESLDHRQLRGHIGYVLQDDHLFDDTVAANIALGDDGADGEHVRWAAAVAGADEFIARLPLGYETRVGETGVRLSGGQEQRIAVARAVYSRPAVLILDEATSSLDADSERAVKRGIAAALPGCTKLVIAHRLSTVTDADRIVVLDRGRIVEQGTHAELLARKGLYRAMVGQQLGD